MVICLLVPETVRPAVPEGYLKMSAQFNTFSDICNSPTDCGNTDFRGIHFVLSWYKQIFGRKCDTVFQEFFEKSLIGALCQWCPISGITDKIEETLNDIHLVQGIRLSIIADHQVNLPKIKK